MSSKNLLQIKKYKKWLYESETDYSPWIKVHEMSSKGLSCIVPGFTTNRNHHTLSNFELSLLLLLDWYPQVTDIKEQYALDPLITSSLADDSKIKHPQFKGSWAVMSTDFLIQVQVAEKKQLIALQAKYHDDLGDKRTIEKLELERRYWKRKNIPWYIVTEKQIPAELTENVRWIQATLCNATKLENMEDKLRLYISFAEKIEPSISIIDFTKQIDSAYNLPLGESLHEIRQLIAWRHLQVDLTKKFNSLKVKDLINGACGIYGRK
jgi:hypothetical protein